MSGRRRVSATGEPTTGGRHSSLEAPRRPALVTGTATPPAGASDGRASRPKSRWRRTRQAGIIEFQQRWRYPGGIASESTVWRGETAPLRRRRPCQTATAAARTTLRTTAARAGQPCAPISRPRPSHSARLRLSTRIATAGPPHGRGSRRPSFPQAATKRDRPAVA